MNARILAALLTGAALLLASPALAGTAWTTCPSTFNAGSAVALSPVIVGWGNGIPPQSNGLPAPRACYDFTDTNPTPPIYAAQSITVSFDPDMNAAASGVVTVQVYRCLGATATLNQCHRIQATALSGDNGVAPAEQASVYNVPAGFYYAIPAGAIGATQPRLMLEVSSPVQPR